MSNIAVCMIVKNEEECLARCLDSIAGLWGELIIVDTGSTDRTIEIAQSYGAKVLHYEWVAPGNKGEARNMGIEAAVSQWIVVVDADEMLIDAPAARAAILAAADNCDGLNVHFANYDNGQCNLTWQQMRVFRRGKWQYKYREHEVPIAIDGKPVAAASDIKIEHRAPQGRTEGKREPMLMRLQCDIGEHPSDPHPLYFLHREYINQGKYREGIVTGQQYLELTKGRQFIRGEIYANMAVAYERTNRPDEARECLHMAAACEPHRRVWLYRLAMLHANCREWQIALAMLRAAVELPNVAHESNPQELAQIYNLIGYCQHEMLHQMAHSHTH